MTQPAVSTTTIAEALLARVSPRAERAGTGARLLAELRCVRSQAGVADDPGGTAKAVSNVLLAAVDQLAGRSRPIGRIDARVASRATLSLLGLDDARCDSSGARYAAAAHHLNVGTRQAQRLVPSLLHALAEEILSLEARAPRTRSSTEPPQWWTNPNQLVAAPALLVGRNDDTAAVVRLSELPPVADRARIVLVHGFAGIGKTSLVAHAAHQVASRYPDAWLWLSVTTSETGAVSADAITRRLLRSIGAREPADPAEAASDLRAALAERAVLIVLDGAENDLQVEAAVSSSPHSLLLVTSRVPMATLDGAAHLRLDRLDDASARQLLLEVGGRRHREDRGLGEVATACHNHPAALRIAGARLSAEPSLLPQQLAGRIRSPGGIGRELRYGSRSIRVLVEGALGQLDDPEIAALRSLVAAEKGAGPGIDISCDRAMPELVARGFVEIDGGEARVVPVVSGVITESSRPLASSR